MKSLTFSASSPAPAQPTEPNTSLVSKRLARSKIDLLWYEKKIIADYARKAFAERMSVKMRAKHDDQTQSAPLLHAWGLMKITLRTRCVAAAQKYFWLNEGLRRYAAVSGQLDGAS